LIAVKVLGCGGSGSWSGVEQGIEWTTNSYIARRRPSVANMSLGGGVSPTTDAAVQKSIAGGVSYSIEQVTPMPTHATTPPLVHLKQLPSVPLPTH